MNSNIDLCYVCWKEEYDAKEKERMNTPVVCVGCHKEKLPAEMKDQFAPTICKECDEIARNVRVAEDHAKRIRNAKPGLVEVVYGVVETPKEDGGSGYAYRFHQKLKLGDVVLVPASWLDEMNGIHGPQEATVISTYSAYDDPVKNIIRVVRSQS